jgi:hypothetical protein
MSRRNIGDVVVNTLGAGCDLTIGHANEKVMG